MLSAAGDPDAAGHVAGAVGEDHRQHDGARLWPGLRARARQGGDDTVYAFIVSDIYNQRVSA